MRTEGTVSNKTKYYLLEFNTSKATKSQKSLLIDYLHGGYRYYYKNKERKTHIIRPLVDNKDIIGVGKTGIMATKEGFQKLKQRIENIKIKIRQKGVFYK